MDGQMNQWTEGKNPLSSLIGVEVYKTSQDLVKWSGHGTKLSEQTIKKNPNFLQINTHEIEIKYFAAWYDHRGPTIKKTPLNTIQIWYKIYNKFYINLQNLYLNIYNEWKAG